MILAREPDLALIDRPEDGLDLIALEQLEQALVDARTAVVLFTHDLRLAAAVSTDVRSFEGGELVAWRGGVDGWRAGRRRREPRPARAAATATTTVEDDRSVASDGPEPALDPPASPAEPSHTPVPDPTVLEEEHAAIEALLEDPLRLGVRERLRLEARRRALVEARMEAYDAGLPRPAPRYRAVEPPLELSADRVGDQLRFLAPDWPATPTLHLVGDVVHLVLPEPDDGCWTGWARAAALRACLSIVVSVLAPTAVQTAAGRAPAPAPFVALDDDWWIASRAAWERWSGWS